MEEPAIDRPSARVVLLDRSDRILLIRSEWDGRSVWFTPGGAVEPGEEPRAAAARELREETGLVVPPGPCIWTRDARWYWESGGTWVHSRERFYLARIDADAPPVMLATAESITTPREARWWTREELSVTREALSPTALALHLGRLLDDDPPGEPVEVGF